MTHWPTARLDECTRIVSGATPSTTVDEYWNGDICWATPKDLSELSSPYLDDTPRKITKSGLDSCATEILPAGSVLFSSRAPIGHVAINRVPTATNQGFKSFIPDPKRLFPAFLYYWLRANRTYLESLGNGATFKEVSKATVSRIEIPIPPLPEQRRIAAILDQAEALRAKRRQALTKLGTLTQSFFIDLFGDPFTNPKGWILRPLGEQLLFLTSGGRGWAEFYSATGSRFIRSFDVQMNYIGTEDVVFVAPPDNAEAERTKVQAGDVLLTITGSRIGRVAPVSQELAGAYISQHVAILRPNPKTIEPLFLSFFLSMESGGQRQIAKHQYGQTKPGLNFESIKSFQVPVPPISDQRDFVRGMRVVERVRNSQTASCSKMDALFASFQYRAFRGEL